MSQVSLEETLYTGLNHQQHEAVKAPITETLQVMAGAGTGKTELITRRFAKLTLDLIEDMTSEDATERIWVSTFTEKAAREMRERIEHYLVQGAGLTMHSKPWIGTFHGLCQRILHREAQHVSHLKGYTLLSSVELDIFREDVLKHILSGDVTHLTEVLHQSGLAVSPNCITPESLLSLNIETIDTVLEEILFKVIPRVKAAGYTPGTFWKDARQQAQAFSDLIRRMPNSDYGQLWDEHEQFAQGWQKHLHPIADPHFSFYPQTWDVEIEAVKALQKQKPIPTALDLLKENLKPLYKTDCFINYNGRKKKDPFSLPTTNFSRLDQQMAMELKLIDLVSAVYAWYQYALRSNTKCDFDDLIQETIHLFTHMPAVLQKYQHHFQHFLVDEFQDSNGGQLHLMQLLCGTTSPRITVVGDKKQSIYGFRFAEPENLHLLFSHTPHAKHIALQTNYRSDPPILAVANQITHMMGLGEQERLNHPETKTNEGYTDVTWFTADDASSVGEARDAETRWIVDTIARLLIQEDVPPNEIAILVRDHRKALYIEDALEAMHIPAIRQRNLGFFQMPVIQQVMALLELVNKPEDDFALINLLQRKLTHRQLYLLATLKRRLQYEMGNPDLCYYETLLRLYHHPDIVPEELKPLRPLIEFLLTRIQEALSKKEECPPHQLLEWLLQAFPLLTSIEQQELKGYKATKNLELLKGILQYWTERSESVHTLADTLALLKRFQEQNTLELPFEEEAFYEQAVRIMTVHGAKGLQFPVVFLAGVDQYRKTRTDGLLTFDPQYDGKTGFGLFLNRYEQDKTLKKLLYDTVWNIPRNQAEELRLFYVAVTRAQRRLYISSWQKSFPYLNPILFTHLPVTTVRIDEADWLTFDQRARMSTEIKTRFWPLTTLKQRSLFPPETLSEPLSQHPLQVIDLESLRRFHICPTQGVLHHHLSTPYSRQKDTLLFPLKNNRWIRLTTLPPERQSDGTVVWALEPEMRDWVAPLFEHLPCDFEWNDIRWISPDPFLVATQSDDGIPTQALILSTLDRFLTCIKENRGFETPLVTPPCLTCAYTHICPHASLSEDSH